jgi:hypothetical protein
LVFSNWTAQKHRHISEPRRWRIRHQFGHWPVKRAIDDHAQRTLVRLMLGNKKHRAPKVRVDHIWMSDQQRTGKIARRPFIAQLTHPKLETAPRACATSRSRRHSISCSVCRVLIYSGVRNGRTAQKFWEILWKILLPAGETSLKP